MKTTVRKNVPYVCDLETLYRDPDHENFFMFIVNSEYVKNSEEPKSWSMYSVCLQGKGVEIPEPEDEKFVNCIPVFCFEDHTIHQLPRETQIIPIWGNFEFLCLEYKR